MNVNKMLKLEYINHILYYDWFQDDKIYKGSLSKGNIYDVAGHTMDELIKNFHDYIDWCLNEQ